MLADYKMKVSGFVPVLLLCLSFSSESLAKGKNQVLKLDDGTWREMLTGEWLVKFYAPWCPACQGIAQIWEKVAGWSEDLNIKVAEIDVSDEAGLSGRFFITALPTIYHVKDGDFRRYSGSRNEDDIISYIEDQRYNEIEAVPWWKHPNSIQMSLLSSIFKLSMHVRTMHNKMVDEWGFPYWLSYLVFAVATVLAGLLLGLIFVVIADSICPPRPPAGTQHRTPPAGEGEPKTDSKKDEGPGEQEQSEKTDEAVEEDKKEEEGEETTVRQRKVGSKGDTEGEAGGGEDGETETGDKKE